MVDPGFQAGPILIQSALRDNKIIFEYSLVVADVPPEAEVQCSLKERKDSATKLIKTSEIWMALLCQIHFKELETEVKEIVKCLNPF